MSFALFSLMLLCTLLYFDLFLKLVSVGDVKSSSFKSDSLKEREGKDWVGRELTPAAMWDLSDYFSL
jgi:hypothetical protein